MSVHRTVPAPPAGPGGGAPPPAVEAEARARTAAAAAAAGAAAPASDAAKAEAASLHDLAAAASLLSSAPAAGAGGGGAQTLRYAAGELQYLRFSRLNRVLHIMMIVSFMSLALTGMTLKFSYTGWAFFLSHLLGGFESAGYVHRLAAVIMFTIFLLHIISLVRAKKAERLTWRRLIFGPDSLMFNRKDLSDFIGAMKWFLGRGDRPKFGRWTYWEKFDYFAVFWGIAVIGSTGLMLWFPELFTRVIPGWFLNVATIIHSDEALLAVGFIFTVHFFNTHLRPEKFPMDIVIFTGRMDLEEFRADKPAEYEELVRAGTLDDHLVEPYQPIVIRAVRVFGWTALTLGFSIVVWIIYAMLFAYR